MTKVCFSISVEPQRYEVVDLPGRVRKGNRQVIRSIMDGELALTAGDNPQCQKSLIEVEALRSHMVPAWHLWLLTYLRSATGGQT